jgi:CO/xanthine dehydrogenase Mo-binding subunit
MQRLDGREKLRGEAEFVGDMSVPGMLFGKVLRSPVPHARIVSIDASRAEAMPGVACVLTGQDLADIDPYWGHAIRDRPIVAIDRVRFHGEPVAAVAADDEATAARALLEIDVTYEELPVAGSIEQAIAPQAPIVNDGPLRPGLFHGLGELPPRDGNVCYRYRIERGEVEGAFARADIVVEGEYDFPAVYQYAMETHTVIAQVERGEITLWATCQHPFLVRAEIAALFERPLSSVRVIVPYLGGGFGSKSYTKMEPITVALARKARRPVRIQNAVGESMVTSRRHGMKARVRTAATSDGRLLGRYVECWFDTGAYADNGPRVTATGGDAAPGPYRWESFRVDARCVYTNTAPSGSYRAFGATHLQWIGESQVDEIARRCDLDPLELRRRNLCVPGEEIRLGGSVGLLAAGAHPVSTAVVRMEADGRVSVLVGTTEMGQGPRTVFAQIAAEVLGIEAKTIVVRGTDSRFTPYDRSTGASRSTTLAGLAVMRAAEDIREQLEEIAEEPEPDPETYPALIERRFGLAGGELIGRGDVHPEGSGSYAEGPVFWEVCVAAAEVTVEPETGIVTVLRSATVADVGRAINPQLVERQDEGATMQGIGNALYEEMVFEDGLLMNDTMLDYRVPTFEDMPGKMTSIVVENGDGPGPFGAKGCGEGALAAVPAAIVNALADAGVPMNTLPLTPERVWRRIQELTQEGRWQT